MPTLTAEEKAERARRKRFEASCRACIKALQPAARAGARTKRLATYEREYVQALARERAERHEWECRGMVTV